MFCIDRHPSTYDYLNNISLSLVLLILVTGLSCGTSKQLTHDIKIIDFDAEKRKLGLINDAECLRRILEQYHSTDTTLIEFAEGNYYFDATIVASELVGNWILMGSGETKFFLSSTLFNIQAAKCKLGFNENIPRHAKQIGVDGLCEDIALLRITSGSIVETAWNYTAGDLVRVQSNTNGALNFRDSLNFSYAPGNTEIYGYKMCSIGLKGIDFIHDSGKSAMFSFTGVSLSISDCDFNYYGETQIPAFVTIYSCEPVKVSQVSMAGKVDYGLLINGSRNVWCTDIRSEECIHPLVPATWTTNVNVKGLHCTGSVIDAHPSFYVTYQDVTIEEGESYWNCRALGVKLENCYFDILDDVVDQSLYLGVIALTDEFAFLYDDYDVYCNNVNWIHQDFIFNGLHVHQCRDFLIENSRTHAVSTGDKIRKFKVENSTIGRLYSSDSNFEVRNTVFDASLQQRMPVRPPLSCSYEGTMIVDHCTFVGYDSTYLFRYIQSDLTELFMTNSHISSIKGLAEMTYMPREAYSRFQIDSTRFGIHVVKSFDEFQGIKYKHE